MGALDVIGDDLEVGLDAHSSAGHEEEVPRELTSVRLLRKLVHLHVAVKDPPRRRVRSDALVQLLRLAARVVQHQGAVQIHARAAA